MRWIPIAAALLASTGATGMTATDARPVHLDIEASGDGVDLVVRGNTGAHADARFELEVESAGTGGTTRTVQSGASRGGGAGGVLLRSRIQTSGLQRWTARLKVTADGREYSETRSSAD